MGARTRRPASTRSELHVFPLCFRHALTRFVEQVAYNQLLVSLGEASAADHPPPEGVVAPAPAPAAEAPAAEAPAPAGAARAPAPAPPGDAAETAQQKAQRQQAKLDELNQSVPLKEAAFVDLRGCVGQRSAAVSTAACANDRPR